MEFAFTNAIIDIRSTNMANGYKRRLNIKMIISIN